MLKPNSIIFTILIINFELLYGFTFHIGATYFKHGFHIIKPGTKWCGTGNIADNDTDLGEYRQLDSCCRQHDKCPDCIAPRENKYNLTNQFLIYMSHCDCDAEFFDCLYKINSTSEENKATQNIGQEYFNVLNMQCFNYTYPAKCVSSKFYSENMFIYSAQMEKCTQYVYNTSLLKEWQLFHVSLFIPKTNNESED